MRLPKTVPYGDPRGPFHRKQAFDLGDCGAGLTANELELGCDCLGMIHVSALAGSDVYRIADECPYQSILTLISSLLAGPQLQ